MPYADLPAFMEKLRALDGAGVGVTALEFLILTAVRSEAVRFAKWSDVADRTWTVPVEQNRKQRQNVEHRVPLSGRAVELLGEPPEGGGFIFHARKPSMPLYDAAMRKVLRAMGYGAGVLTAHGFRATFKTWATEKTNIQREVIEAALAHVVGGKVGDLFEKRRQLMYAWAAYCMAQPDAKPPRGPTRTDEPTGIRGDVRGRH
jgi:integrase